MCVFRSQTANKKWKKEGGWGESKSDSLHVMRPAAAATCRVVNRLHFQALGREIVTSICNCCRIVVLCTQGRARCTIMRNQEMDEHVLLSGRCARVEPEAAGAAQRIQKQRSKCTTVHEPVQSTKF